MLERIPLRLLAIMFVAGALGGAAILWGLSRGQVGAAEQTIGELRRANDSLRVSLDSAEVDSERLKNIVGSLSGIAGSLEEVNRSASGEIDDSLRYLGLLEGIIGQLEGALRAADLID